MPSLASRTTSTRPGSCMGRCLLFHAFIRFWSRSRTVTRTLGLCKAITAAVGPPAHVSDEPAFKHPIHVGQYSSNDSPTYPAPIQQTRRIAKSAAVLGSRISGSVACIVDRGVPTRQGRGIASIGGIEYACASRLGDTSAGVGRIDVSSTEDSSDRPKDGVEAMDEASVESAQ